MDKTAMLEWARKYRENICGDDVYKDDLSKIMYEFINKFKLVFDVDCLDNGSDCWLQSTVYVNRLVWLNGYNVILDCDFNSYFESPEEFVEVMLQEHNNALEILSHFKN